MMLEKVERSKGKGHRWDMAEMEKTKAPTNLQVETNCIRIGSTRASTTASSSNSGHLSQHRRGDRRENRALVPGASREWSGRNDADGAQQASRNTFDIDALGPGQVEGRLVEQKVELKFRVPDMASQTLPIRVRPTHYVLDFGRSHLSQPRSELSLSHFLSLGGMRLVSAGAFGGT